MELKVGKKYKVKIPQLTGGSCTESRLYVNSEMLLMEDTILTVSRIYSHNKLWVDTVESRCTWDIHTLVPIYSKKLIGGELC